MPVSPAQRSLYRILDANLDRAREGIRVIEEWCRFNLENPSLTHQCKALRQQLGQWHRPEFRLARNTPEDPGTTVTHPHEQQRADMQSVLQANFCRVQEALRVLEEYAKVEDAAMAAAFKQMRYQVYTLESQLMHQPLPHARQQKLQEAQLYLVTSASDRLFEVVELALQGGVDIVQYRDKQGNDSDRIHNCQRLSDLCHRYDALFIVNDRPDIALLVGADGVHVGQQDLPVAAVRTLMGTEYIVGCSTTSPEEMQRSLIAQPDYIGVGPVYETPTKAGKQAVGLDYVRYAAAHALIPWFVIGGIDTQNLADVVGAGATRAAVVRAIMEADHPDQVSRTLAKILGKKPLPKS